VSEESEERGGWNGQAGGGGEDISVKCKFPSVRINMEMAFHSLRVWLFSKGRSSGSIVDRSRYTLAYKSDTSNPSRELRAIPGI